MTNEDYKVREKVLQSAMEYVMHDRNVDYDTPERNFEQIAGYCNIFLAGRDLSRHPIQPFEIAVIMSFVKISRIKTSPAKIDHWIDLAGYAACGAECVGEAVRQEEEAFSRFIGDPEEGEP